MGVVCTGFLLGRFLEIYILAYHIGGFPGGTSGKEPACQCRNHKRCCLDPWVRKIPWRRAWQPTPVVLAGESHGQRSLMGYSSRGLQSGTQLSDWTIATVWARSPHQRAPWMGRGTSGAEESWELVWTGQAQRAWCRNLPLFCDGPGPRGILFILKLFVLFWSTVDWQGCNGFRCTAERLSRRHIEEIKPTVIWGQSVIKEDFVISLCISVRRMSIALNVYRFIQDLSSKMAEPSLI